MTNRISHIAAYIAVFAGLLTAGCKENTIINTNITPAGDSISTNEETINITAKTVESHYITSTYNSGIHVVQGIGHLVDPNVVETDASMYMQVVPKQSSGYTLPANIDSFVLVLPYANFTYGDTANSVAQTFKVYRVTDNLYRDSTYYDYTNKAFDATELGSAIVNYNSLNDSLSIEGKSTLSAPHLRIKMDYTATLNMLNSANYSSYADFLSSMRGLYIKSTTTGKTIPYFRLTDDNAGNSYSKAGIVVYYHGDSAGVVKYDLFGHNPDNCAHFNRIINTISTSVLNDANNVYLQSRPGMSIEISTTDLKTHANKLVNKAELIITEADPYIATPAFFASDWTYPYTIGGGDSLLSVADAVFKSPSGSEASGINFINGKVKQVFIPGSGVHKQYVINVPREFQKALKEGREMKIRVAGVTNGYIGAYRLKAGGTNPNSATPALNIQLKVVYSGVQ